MITLALNIIIPLILMGLIIYLMQLLDKITNGISTDFIIFSLFMFVFISFVVHQIDHTVKQRLEEEIDFVNRKYLKE